MNTINFEKLRISLKSYEASVLDNSCLKIITAIKSSGVNTVGPVPLPTRTRRYCVLTSPHVNKDAREHFEIRTHKRIIDVYSPCLLYTSPSPRDISGSRMPSSA